MSDSDPFDGNIEWDNHSGLAIVFAEDPTDTASDNPVNSKFLESESLAATL